MPLISGKPLIQPTYDRWGRADMYGNLTLSYPIGFLDDVTWDIVRHVQMSRDSRLMREFNLYLGRDEFMRCIVFGGKQDFVAYKWRHTILKWWLQCTVFIYNCIPIFLRRELS